MFRRDTRGQIRHIRNAQRSVTIKLREISSASSKAHSTPDYDLGYLVYSIHDALSSIVQSLTRLDTLLDKGEAFPPSGVKKLVDDAEAVPELVKDLCLVLTKRHGTRAKMVTNDLKTSVARLEKAVHSLKPPEAKFAKELKKLLDRCDLTGYGLAMMTGLDDSYTYKLLKGEKSNPRRQTVTDIGHVLQEEFPELVTTKDLDRLLKAAGFRSLKRKPRRHIFWFIRL